MLFISQHQYLIAGAIKPVDEYHPATGRYLGTKAGVDVQFMRGKIPKWAEPIALEQLNFNGLPDGTDPLLHLYAYDSDQEAYLQKWTPDMKAEVEAVMLADGGCGLNRHGFLRVELPSPAVPYPNYEKQTALQGRRTIEHVYDKLRELVEQDGYEIPLLIAFEQYLNRSESAQIVAFLEALQQKPVEDADVVVTA